MDCKIWVFICVSNCFQLVAKKLFKSNSEFPFFTRQKIKKSAGNFCFCARMTAIVCVRQDISYLV